MKKNVILIITAILLMIFVGVTFFIKRPKETEQIGSQSKTNSYKIQTNIEGEVQMSILPINLFDNLPRWSFRITTNTHSIDVSEDFKRTIELVDDKGGVFQPNDWQGDVEGHHRTGILYFPAINPKPKFIELKVKNLGGVEMRVFRWEL